MGEGRIRFFKCFYVTGFIILERFWNNHTHCNCYGPPLVLIPLLWPNIAAESHSTSLVLFQNFVLSSLSCGKLFTFLKIFSLTLLGGETNMLIHGRTKNLGKNLPKNFVFFYFFDRLPRGKMAPACDPRKKVVVRRNYGIS